MEKEPLRHSLYIKRIPRGIHIKHVSCGIYVENQGEIISVWQSVGSLLAVGINDGIKRKSPQDAQGRGEKEGIKKKQDKDHKVCKLFRRVTMDLYITIFLFSRVHATLLLNLSVGPSVRPYIGLYSHFNVI